MELKEKFGGSEGIYGIDLNGYMGYQVDLIIIPYLVVLWKKLDYYIIKITLKWRVMYGKELCCG